jgi:cell shape-determining protein MreC
VSAQLKALSPNGGKVSASKSQSQYDLISKRLSAQLHAVPAQVIYRSPSTWNSTLWLNVGTVDNELNETDVIAKNSPVIVGTSIVGVIDYVGKNQSRVRLITNSGLSPSVRAVRGDINKRLVAEQIALLINRFSCTHGLFKTQDEKELMLKQLVILQKRLVQSESQGMFFLAKGEVHGGSEPLWRSPGAILKGIGFNYDFPDDQGPARDLRTGKPLNGTDADKTMPILLVNDLLVTTGMDGVFPAGFYVAEVTKIEVLKEGDYFYELEAKPTAGDLQELTTVFVIPPVKREEFIN